MTSTSPCRDALPRDPLEDPRAPRPFAVGLAAPEGNGPDDDWWDEDEDDERDEEEDEEDEDEEEPGPEWIVSGCAPVRRAP